MKVITLLTLHIGKICGECGNCELLIYRSGRRFYKCGLKRECKKGRAVKKSKAACLAFKDGEPQKLHQG
jgi:hypothetical protein